MNQWSVAASRQNVNKPGKDEEGPVQSAWGGSVRPAATLQAMRNRLLMSADGIRAIIDSFNRNHMDNADDDMGDVYHEFLKHLLHKMGAKAEPQNWVQVQEGVLRRFQHDHAISSRKDFQSLVLMCKRARAFDRFVELAKEKLQEAYFLTEKYCQSFAAENEGYIFPAVETYENQIVQTKMATRAGFEKVETMRSTIAKISPISSYLERYNRVLHYMGEAVDTFSELATALTRWLHTDDKYERALERDLRQTRARRGAAIERRHKLGASRQEARRGPIARVGAARKCEEELRRCVDRLARLRMEEVTAEATSCKLDKEITDRERLVRNLRRSAAGRQPEDVIHSIESELAVCKGELGERRRELGTVKCTLRKVREEMIDCQRSQQTLGETLERCEKDVNATRERLIYQDKSVQDALKEAKHLEAMVKVLEKIRSLKKNSQTLKKLENDVLTLDYKEAMTDAISQASKKVQGRWPELYTQYLDFSPPRPLQTLEADVANTRDLGERWGLCQQEMAQRALTKWARQSVTSSARDLLYAVSRLVSPRPKMKAVRGPRSFNRKLGGLEKAVVGASRLIPV